MARFAIITPTIGRQSLKRCLQTMEYQVYRDFMHIVVGDGPQEKWVEDECQSKGCIYTHTPIKEAFYGTAPRNHALTLLESGVYGHYDYVLFLDDDNLLLEPALYNANFTIESNNRPDLVWHDILFVNKFKTSYYVLPQSGVPLTDSDWDNLNGVYKKEIINGLRFEQEYTHDIIYSRQATERSKQSWVKSTGISGVHCLSWDTFNLPKPS